MAWNGSNGGASTLKKESQKSAPSVLKGALALVLVVAVGALAYWFVVGEKPKELRVEPAHTDKLQQIAEVQPEVAPTPEVEAPTPKPIDPNARPTKVGEEVNNYVMLPDGTLHKRNGLKVVNVSEWNTKSRYQIFDHFTDNEFATLLTVPPGESLIGGGVFPANYEEQFLKSLQTPIIISKEDPEDIQELKKAIIKTRMEMKDVYDRGEDIRQYVSEAYEEIQRMAAYKDDISAALKDYLAKPDVTEQDLDDFMTSANTLLEEKGIAPITMGPFMKARLLQMRK